MYCENTTMADISTINNQGCGIYMYHTDNTTMAYISTINNQDSGVSVLVRKNTTMADISTINNQHNGLSLDLCKNTTMTNVFAINNTNEGIITVKCNNTILADINASYNQNGGIVMESHFQNTVLRNTSVNHNGANQITFSYSENIQLEYSTFSDIIPLPTLNITTNQHSMPAVIELNDCTVIFSNCIFTRNNITSIRAIGSNIIVELFVSSSVLVISETSIVQNNCAVNYGGAIYILTDEYYNKTITEHGQWAVFSHSMFTRCRR